jgi:hypothetical protein
MHNANLCKSIKDLSVKYPILINDLVFVDNFAKAESSFPTIKSYKIANVNEKSNPGKMSLNKNDLSKLAFFCININSNISHTEREEKDKICNDLKKSKPTADILCCPKNITNSKEKQKKIFLNFI